MWLGLRAALFALLLPGTVLVGMPLWLWSLDGPAADLGLAAQVVGVPLLVVGVAALAWCIWDFAQRGRGTLAPVDPPRFVVRSGLYRVVRNPMYVAVLTTLAGEALVAGHLLIAGWALAVAAAVHTFVVLYEEPALRQQFGGDYLAYCDAVPRWLPRRPREPDGPVDPSESP
jgi:protein-S-isoprenylcysteine O-methyltransferase Ste14